MRNLCDHSQMMSASSLRSLKVREVTAQALCVLPQESHFMGKGLGRGNRVAWATRGTSPPPLVSYVPQETSSRKGWEPSERDHPTSAGVPCSCGSFWWPLADLKGVVPTRSQTQWHLRSLSMANKDDWALGIWGWGCWGLNVPSPITRVPGARSATAVNICRALPHVRLFLPKDLLLGVL